ncbi:Mitochondrial ribonuclease P protein 1-like, partial [Homarus americanus]
MQHSVVALVCPALYASARHLTLLGRRPISRQFFLLRAPSVCAKVSWHGAPSCQHLQWAGETVKGEPQLGEVKWYCTSTKPYTHSEIGGSAVNSARAGEKLLTNTKEFESSYNKPGSRRTKDKGVLSNAMHKIDEGIVVEETKATAVVEVSEGSIDSFYGSEEEVDLEELIKLEIELHRQEGVPVPSEITPTQWEELLAKSSMQGRKKYLKFLFKNEMKRENTKKKKELKRKIREEKEKEMEENPKVGEDQDVHIQYGLWRNSIFLKILDTTMNHFYNSRVISAMMHGQPLVIDMGFDDHMVSRERQNCAYQI